MEQDWTSERVAEAAHAALNATFQTQLNQLADELGALHPQPTRSDTDEIALKIQQAMTDAIVQRGGILQDVLNLVNADDFLGAQPFIFIQSSLETTPSQPFSARFKTAKDGDWEITGHVNARKAIRLPGPLPVRP